MFTTFPSFSDASRRGRACDSCRKLKIKCRNPSSASAGYTCLECRRARLKCTYRDEPAKRGRPGKEDQGSSSGKAMFETVVDLNAIQPSCAVGKAVPITEMPSETKALSDPRCDNGVSHRDAQRSNGIMASSFTLTDPFSSGEFQALPGHTPSPDMMPQATQIDVSCASGLQCYQDIWTCVHEFFDTIYIMFPIISYVEIVSRLIVHPDWASSPDLRVLYYMLRLSIAAAKCRTTSSPQYRDEVCNLVQHVEASRLSYNLNDAPTLDAVVISLCLFVSYDVLGNEERSLLYLCEASYLLEMFIPTTSTELERKSRIEMVLFNAESASFGIYAIKGFIPTARRPYSDGIYRQLEVLGNNDESEKLALHFLHRLTRIHLADNVDDLNEISLASEQPIKSSFGPENSQHHRYACIQAADTAITHQWLLSNKMLARQSQNLDVESRARSSIEILGVSALSWASILTNGDLRIVGLSKVAGLALNMWALGSLEISRDILHGLTDAVVKEDFEGKYSLTLANLIEKLTFTVPPWFGGPYDGATDRDILDELTDIRPSQMINGLFEGGPEPAASGCLLVDQGDPNNCESN